MRTGHRRHSGVSRPPLSSQLPASLDGFSARLLCPCSLCLTNGEYYAQGCSIRRYDSFVPTMCAGFQFYTPYIFERAVEHVFVRVVSWLGNNAANVAER